MPTRRRRYNAYSGEGDVTGEVVYVNYGVPADYDKLKELGIDVKGKIVLARYGQSWRGIKPKVAYEHGAIGCLIYSDPETTGISPVMSIRAVRSGRSSALSAAASWTCPSIRGIR